MLVASALLVRSAAAETSAATSTGAAPSATAASPAPRARASKSPKGAQAELKLQRDKLLLERDRLNFEASKFEDEQLYRPSAFERWFSSSAAGALITGVLGMLLFRFLTKPWEQKKFEEAERTARGKLEADHQNERQRLEAERERMWDEVAISRSTTLLTKRTDAYTKLWGHLAKLSLYPLPDEFSYENAKEIQEQLKTWYFSGSGMYLMLEPQDRIGSKQKRIGSRSRYFALQRALRFVSQAKAPGELQQVMIPPGASISEQEVKEDEKSANEFSTGEVGMPDGDFERYRMIRALGSLLRTAMVEDLGTRNSLAER